MRIVRILAAVVLGFTALAVSARADQITLATASGAWTYFGSGFNPSQFQSTLADLSHVSAPTASSAVRAGSFRCRSRRPAVPNPVLSPRDNGPTPTAPSDFRHGDDART